MSIEERAEAAIKAKHPKLQPSDQFKEFFTEGFEAGTTEQQALIDQQKIAANTPPADVLKGYGTYEENSAHQSGFLIGCEWKESVLEARIKELEEENKRLNATLKTVLDSLI